VKPPGVSTMAVTIILLVAGGLSACSTDRGSQDAGTSQPASTTTSTTASTTSNGPDVDTATPSRSCEENIGLGPGSNPSPYPAIDLIVGPVRFGGLLDSNLVWESQQLADTIALVAKTPIYVIGADLEAVTIRVMTDDDSVHLMYRLTSVRGFGSSYRFTSDRDAVTLESARRCLQGAADSWVGYSGAIVALHAGCATLQITGANGETFGSRTISIGDARC